MFQYAAVRVLAEQQGYSFCYFPLRDARFYWRTTRKRLSEKLGRAQAHPGKQLAQSDISTYFTLGSEPSFMRFAKRLVWRLAPNAGRTQFHPQRKIVEQQYNYEIFDETLKDVKDWTELFGGYQSVAYFEDQREKVLDWFKLKPKYANDLKRLETTFPAAPEKRCCIHIRRGDQLHHDKGLGWKDQGWAMPFEYYKEALKHIPDDVFFVIATDSPDYVKDAFNFLPNKYICANNSEAVDMHLFTVCKYNIIANSTFSWWGAWLNQIDDAVIIAPKYHMGWTRQTWIPWAFEHHPQSWTYLDVLPLVSNDMAQS